MAQSNLAISAVGRVPVTAVLPQASRQPIQRQEPVQAKPVSSKQSFDNDERTGLIKNISCSAIRAFGRFTEASVEAIGDNPLVRVPFRFLTEVVRNGSSASIHNIATNKKVTKKLWIDGAKKGLENAVATAVFEPNRYTGTFARVGAGFANMLVRFTARVALVALAVVSPSELGIEGMPDDLAVRSIGRVIKPFSDNPIVGFGTRFVEQLLINFGTDKMFLRNHILPVVKEKIATSKKLQPTAEAKVSVAA